MIWRQAYLAMEMAKQYCEENHNPMGVGVALLASRAGTAQVTLVASLAIVAALAAVVEVVIAAEVAALHWLNWLH